MRLVYMGTPDFAVKPLEALQQAGHEIVCCVCQPDKPQGRHAELKKCAVKEKAEELHIPVLQPEKASDPLFLDEIERLAPDVIVVAAYGKILKKRLLEIPKSGCINIHGSLLPRWRGAAPIQWSVIAGDRESGITTMMMDEGLDTGDMLLSESVTLAPDETGGSLFERLSFLAGPLIVKTLEELEKNTLVRIPQDPSLVTYAPSLTKEMGELDFAKPAEELERLIRGLSPWPGAYTFLSGKMLKIHHAETAGFCDKGEPGKFLIDGDGLFVVCGGSSLLRLTEVQLEGKKRMSSADFLRGQKALVIQSNG